MKLYHVSEEANISEFIPRLPTRADLNPDVALVWALCERTLPNFFTPRNCPRVCYHIGNKTTQDDIVQYMTEESFHVVVIEKDWLERMRETVLYIYEFNDVDFYLQDESAGYYVSEKKQISVAVHKITDCETELKKHGVTLKIVDELWSVSDEIKQTTFNWSLCRMAFAKNRKSEKNKIGGILMNWLKLHIPSENEFEYRRQLISDQATMKYNAGYGDDRR